MEDGSRRLKEALRYMGCRGEAVPQMERLAKECFEALEEACTPRYLAREFPLSFEEDGWMDGGCFRTGSRSLGRNLKDCSGVLAFGATLGAGADRLIQKYTRLEMSRAVALQAAAAAMIEEYCDQACGELKDIYEKKGLYLRPRFSPGYGDFPLACQPGILDGLEAGKRIGIRLTDSLLMMPSKSVTAVIGIGTKPLRCAVSGCGACGKRDCAYRREG